jgi:DNA-binding transcriptional LysR family regulator
MVLRLPMIEAFAHQHNSRSHRVLIKIGMQQDGIAILPQRTAPDLPASLRSFALPASSGPGEIYFSYSKDRGSYVSAYDRAD